jgi:hypothetical protein
MRKLCLLLLLVVGAASGCDDDGPGGPVDMSVSVPNNFDEINQFVFGPLCANFSVCHSRMGQNTAGHLNLADDPYAELVGVLSDNKMAAAEGVLLVKPCDPDNSFLWTKLTLPESMRDSKVGYGASMPKDNPHLPMEQLQAIRNWIARGAHRFEPADVTGDTCVTDDASMQDLSMVD